MAARHLGSFNAWLTLLGSIGLSIELKETKDLVGLDLQWEFEEVACNLEGCAAGDDSALEDKVALRQSL